MALQRDARYPGRWTAASSGHPQGAFKNRTAPGSLDGSYIEQDWANDWDGYFSSLLGAAGLTANGTVDAVGASQYFTALTTFLQSQIRSSTGNFAFDSGTANAYAATYTSTITGFSEGMLLSFKATNANTGASTFSPNGATAAPIVGAAHQPLQGGEITLFGDISVRWNGSIGTGSWVIVSNTGGGMQTAPATQPKQAPQLSQIGHGQCRLSVVSTTQLKLSPYNGNNLIINGVPQPVPSAGVTISNGSLSASTLYYVYAFMSSGTMTLELSATGHATGTTGIEQKTGDATRTLVGMIYTNTSSQFVDSPTQRLCMNWFNRRDIAAYNILSANRSTTSSTPVEITTAAERVQILNWGDQTVITTVGGVGSQNTAGSFSTFSSLDGSTAGAVSTISPPAGQASAMCPSNPWIVAEGFHYGAILGTATAGFTATWPASTNTITARTQG